jgi:hypothetical protein
MIESAAARNVDVRNEMPVLGRDPWSRQLPLARDVATGRSTATNRRPWIQRRRLLWRREVGEPRNSRLIGGLA